MEPYQMRVVDELSELNLKIGRLETFVNYNQIVSPEAVLLSEQLEIMKSYAEILNKRIRLWDE